MAFNKWKENSWLAVDSGSGHNQECIVLFIYPKFKQPFYFFICYIVAYADSYAITKECWKGIKKVMTRYGCSLILFLSVHGVTLTYHAISILFEIKQQSEIRFHFICNYFVLSKNKAGLICWQLKISMKYMARCFGAIRVIAQMKNMIPVYKANQFCKGR